MLESQCKFIKTDGTKCLQPIESCDKYCVTHKKIVDLDHSSEKEIVTKGKSKEAIAQGLSEMLFSRVHKVALQSLSEVG